MTNQTNLPPTGLSSRRDLGTVESYAALIGILIGAGIFKVTSDAGAITGPSVILSYIILMPGNPGYIDSLCGFHFHAVGSRTGR
jgi:hypothetical protein